MTVDYTKISTQMSGSKKPAPVKFASVPKVKTGKTGDGKATSTSFILFIIALLLFLYVPILAIPIGYVAYRLSPWSAYRKRSPQKIKELEKKLSFAFQHSDHVHVKVNGQKKDMPADGKFIKFVALLLPAATIEKLYAETLKTAPRHVRDEHMINEGESSPLPDDYFKTN